MEEYLEATTLHGFAYLQRRNSSCARLFWSITILAGFTLASYFLYGSLIDWEENQTITTLQSIATPIQHVQFPTVTVGFCFCHLTILDIVELHILIST